MGGSGRQWEAARGGHARAPDPSPKQPSPLTSPRRQSLAQPHARSWCCPPGAPTPRQSPTHSKPPGPRRPPAAAAAGAGWLPAALWDRAIAGSSALQERNICRHRPVVPCHHPATGHPCSHLGWALLSSAPAARSRRDCHRHRGRWVRGPRRTSGRHRPRSGPCPGRPDVPALCPASKGKCSWFP